MAAYTTIDDPSAHFQTALWTGDGNDNKQITNDGNSDLKPDLVWLKDRTQAESHAWFDSSRGASVRLQSNNTNAESTESATQKSFTTDGFTVGTSASVNNGSNPDQYVGWQWKANGGTTATNTTGNGIDSVVQANTTAGFSIVTYTGNGTQSGQTVGHGLGAVPKVIISKDRNASSNVPHWRVYHESIGNTKYLSLSEDVAASVFNDWDNTTPTSSVYSVGGAGGYTPTNNNNTPYVAYVFAEKQGYSKFGKYIGNGSADGTFVYLGFQPAFVMLKSSSIAVPWLMFDNKRDIANGDMDYLLASSNAAESNAGLGNSAPIDFLSNGFKLRNADAYASGANTYIYMAFAENPFVTSTGIPTTAR